MVEIRGVAHFNIPVSDIATSTQFYTDVVGCRHLFTTPNEQMVFYWQSLRQWSPRRRHVAPQLNVVLGKKHHADILKGPPNSVGRDRARLPTFQLEVVDVALAHRSGARQLADGPTE
jgi:catechol 2,3-dioxygenase-like lactoylglutathione lyase family enzyme